VELNEERIETLNRLSGSAGDKSMRPLKDSRGVLDLSVCTSGTSTLLRSALLLSASCAADLVRAAALLLPIRMKPGFFSSQILDQFPDPLDR
jgi:hypothetical protein